jgi:hypothetical protein
VRTNSKGRLNAKRDADPDERCRNVRRGCRSRSGGHARPLEGEFPPQGENDGTYHNLWKPGQPPNEEFMKSRRVDSKL